MIETTVLITCYGNPGPTRAAIATAREFMPGSILVVDDASDSADVADVVRACARHGAEMMVLPRNLGQAGAINAGVQQVKTPYVVLMDNDVTLFGGDWLREHIRILNSDDRIAGVSGCSNPDFKDSRAETYHYAETFGESGYCEFPCSGLITLRTETARAFPQIEGHPGMWPDSLWEVGLIRSGMVMYVSRANAYHHDNTNRYEHDHYRPDCVSFLADYGRDVLRPKHSREECRWFMQMGIWPAPPA